MNRLVALILAMAPIVAFSQFGVNFHQSNLPFIGFNYEINDKLRPELRIGTDTFFESSSVEGVVTYDLLNNEDYEFYGGLGIRLNGFTGLVIPLGLNFYPLPTKNFGFHIELAPIVGEDEILRGSWGIRYRFRKGS